MEQDRVEREGALYVAGIGASAGALEALQKFVAGIRFSNNLAYIVAQHLSPRHVSLLSQLLARETSIQVTEARDDIPVEAGRIYVTPPNADVAVNGGRLRLLAGGRKGPKPSVDILLRSLADEYGDRAIAVVLSGTGSDGAAGVIAVKAAGGIVLAQDNKSARYAGMPEAAVKTGCVDIVLSAGRLAEEVFAIANPLPRPEAAAGNIGGEHIAAVLRTPREQSGFFRDPDHFTTLIEVLKEATAKARETFRIWVPGCATGEEAYTLAILMHRLGPRCRVQLFATDLDDGAIDFARRGIYAEAAIKHIDPQIAAQYFQRTSQGYQVVRTIRDMIIFSCHDLVRDPPFIRLDVISCRNVHIYFTQETQAASLSAFHQALNPGGILFLGKSESIGHAAELFEEVNCICRIYRSRAVDRTTRRALTRAVSHSRLQTVLEHRRANQMDATGALRTALLRHATPVAVLIDSNMAVIQSHGEIRRFLTLDSGKIDLRLTSLLPKPAQGLIRSQLTQVRRTGRPEKRILRRVHIGEDVRNIAVSIFPAENTGPDHYFVVAFEDVLEVPTSEGSAISQDYVDALHKEMADLQEHPETVVDQLETSNEELQLLNEEMQSSNEELVTVSDELSQTSSKLSLSVLDLENIQESLMTPILVVDEELTLLRNNEHAGRWLGLTPQDLNRKLSFSQGKLRELPLLRMVKGVLRSGRPLERQITDNRKKYLVRVHPYRGAVHSRRACIVTAIDVTALARAKEQLVGSREHLRLLGEQYETMLNGLEANIVLLDKDGTILTVNEAWRRFASENGSPDSNSYVGTNYLEACESVLGPEEFEAHEVARSIRAVLSGARQSYTFEYPCHGANRKRWFRCVVTPTSRTANLGAVVVHMEITRRVLAERNSELQVAALEAVANGVFITGGDGAILWVNRAFTRITGFSEDEIIGQPARALLGGPRDLAQWEHIWAQVQDGRVWRGEAVKQHRDGHLITVQQTVNPIAGPGGQTSQVVVILDDITARKQAEWHILHMAQHDSLTGLPNRNLFHERLNQAMEWARRRDRRIALLLLDLDQFKDTNDTMGHLIGDTLLVAVARRLEGKLPAADTLGRLGGDEFAILVEDVSSRESLAEYAQRVLSAFREPFALHEHTVNITASLGVAMYPDDGITVEDLLRGADIAMYKAKNSARNAYRFYDAETDKETADRVRMVRELRGAFHNGSLRVAFQPQVDLADGRVIAAEALIRWTHDSLGEVSPAHLIHIAEASGLIHTLGDWVLNEVCRQIRQWRDQGLPVVPVAVNLSAMQLTEERTVEHLLDPLERHGIEARLLMVEITESVLLQHSDRVRKTLYDLHSAGISLVLDDFGTGYSSLTYLRQYPVSCLKVDVSFVHGVGTNTSDEQIISAMLSLARALGIKVVAEGVETAEQAEFLKARACDAAQGYYFGRPMTPAEFAAVLRSESESGPRAKAQAAGE